MNNITQSLSFEQWHYRVKTVGKSNRYIIRRIGYGPILMRPWYDEGLSPEQAFERYRELDQQAYREWLDNLKTQAAQYEGLTKAALNRFIVWSTSRYNEHKKANVVDIAYEMLATGTYADSEKSVMLFRSGSYTECSSMSGTDYLIHGAEHYIARGRGDSVEHFHEYERLEFRKVESEVEG